MTTPLVTSTYSIGGFTLNARDEAGVEWIVTEDKDWWSGPTRRTDHSDRPNADGAARGRSYASARKMTLEGCTICTTRSQRDQVLADWAALGADGALLTLEGPAPDGPYQLAVDLESADMESLNDVAFRWQIVTVAPDPVKYSAQINTTGNISLPASSGGLTFPLTFPFTFPAVVDQGSAFMVNSGTAPVGFFLRVQGPVEDPVISLVTNGVVQTLLLTGIVLGADQWLDINTAERTVLLNGTGNRRGFASGEFPILPANSTSELVWMAESFSAGQLSATWRSGRY